MPLLYIDYYAVCYYHATYSSHIYYCRYTLFYATLFATLLPLLLIHYFAMPPYAALFIFIIIGARRLCHYYAPSHAIAAVYSLPILPLPPTPRFRYAIIAPFSCIIYHFIPCYRHIITLLFAISSTPPLFITLSMRCADYAELSCQRRFQITPLLIARSPLMPFRHCWCHYAADHAHYYAMPIHAIAAMPRYWCHFCAIYILMPSLIFRCW